MAEKKQKLIGQCPACRGKMYVTGLQCEHCSTSVQGAFALDDFFKLSSEQLLFVKTFLRNRGSIKEVEKELGISYPTVRNKLDEVIETLGFKVERVEQDKKRRKEILSQLEKGKISSEEAIEQLRALSE